MYEQKRKYVVRGEGFVMYMDAPPVSSHRPVHSDAPPVSHKPALHPLKLGLVASSLATFVLAVSVLGRGSGAQIAAQLSSASLAPAVTLTSNITEPTSAQCPRQVNYRIGSLDPRFGLDAAMMTEVAEEAADIWNTAAGDTVLSYSVTGSVPINLVYGDAQQRSDASFEGTQKVSGLQAQIDDLDHQITSMKDAIDADNAQLTSDSNVWQLLGASPQMTAELQQRSADLDSRVAGVNALIAQRNALAAQANGIIDDTPAGNGEETTGLYTSDASGQRIDLLYYENMDQLRWTLAHEMGHALGLDHVSTADVQNIGCLMAPVDFEEGHPVPTLRLCTADLKALRELCN